MQYSDEVIDHAKHPKNFGELEGATHTAKESNATCGDMVEFYLKIENGVVEKAGFRGVGCAMSTAMASMLTEKVVGMTVKKLKSLDEKITSELMGEVNSGRRKCVMLPVMAVRNAVGKEFDILRPRT